MSGPLAGYDRPKYCANTRECDKCRRLDILRKVGGRWLCNRCFAKSPAVQRMD